MLRVHEHRCEHVGDGAHAGAFVVGPRAGKADGERADALLGRDESFDVGEARRVRGAAVHDDLDFLDGDDEVADAPVADQAGGGVEPDTALFGREAAAHQIEYVEGGVLGMRRGGETGRDLGNRAQQQADAKGFTAIGGRGHSAAHGMAPWSVERRDGAVRKGREHHPPGQDDRALERCAGALHAGAHSAEVTVDYGHPDPQRVAFTLLLMRPSPFHHQP